MLFAMPSSAPSPGIANVVTPDNPVVFAATGLEASKARARVRHGADILETGIALTRIDRTKRHAVAIGCGLSGGLCDDAATGTIVIPNRVATENGAFIGCDPEWSTRLRDAARRLGYTVAGGDLLTSAHLVVGEERLAWARRGFTCVDMETALFPADRIAAVRVILDTPGNELSTDWLNPALAFLNPKNWRQGIWLARNGPRCAAIAAEIVAEALRERL
jgi:hypothetical protein